MVKFLGPLLAPALLTKPAQPSVLHCQSLMADTILAPIDESTNFINNQNEFFIDGANSDKVEEQIFKPIKKNLAEKANPTACCGPSPYDSSIKGCCNVQATRPAVFNLNSQGCCVNEENGISKLFETSTNGCCSGNIYSKSTHDCCSIAVSSSVTGTSTF